MTNNRLYFRAAIASILFVAATAEECPCPTDKTLRIGGVSHGNVADAFWDPVYAAAERAALDSGVELDFDRYDMSSSQTGQGVKASLAGWWAELKSCVLVTTQSMWTVFHH